MYRDPGLKQWAHHTAKPGERVNRGSTRLPGAGPDLGKAATPGTPRPPAQARMSANSGCLRAQAAA